MFASINFGTCVKPGGRLASKALLKAQDDGIGKGVTSLFPITIFKLKNGISYAPGDPNYDLRLMAEKVTAKRQFPNYSNIDAPYNLKFYKEGHPETEVAYMGMAKGTETISYYSSATQEYAFVANFETFYMWTKSRKDSLYRSTGGDEQHREHIYNENTYWYDVSDLDLYAADPLAPNGRTRIKKIMCALAPAKGEAWQCIKLDNKGKTEAMYFTTDHPLNVVGKGRTQVKDIKVGDYIVAADGTTDTVKVIDSIYIMADLWIGYDVETESDRLVIGSISSHNCRTRVIANVNGPEIVTDRGNLSFTTLNLPRYAIEAVRESSSEEEGIRRFFEKLDKYLDVAKRQLQHRFEIQCRRHVYNFPYIMGQGAYMGSEYLTSEDEVRKVLQNGTLSFGFVGLAEALVCLTGHDHSEGEEYQSLGLRIVKHMKDYADKLTATERMNWTLIGTPAESVAGRFLRIDKEKFGVIPGVTDKEYYTNSCHVPVTKQIRASEKLRIEAPYHPLCNAGLITYVECAGDPRENLDALHTLINIAHDAGIGYFSFNHKVDTCTNCGYNGIIGDICPSCGQKETPSHPFMRPRRLTGYLNYENRFNSAKAAELKDRVTHA